MDNLLPAIRIVKTSLPAERQQRHLNASREAKAQQRRSQFAQPQDHRLRDPKTAFEEVPGGSWCFTFGLYTGRTFRWPVENDVGLIDRHVKESLQLERRAAINEEWVKDSLLKYVELVPPVSCHLEINVDRAIYGPARFRSFTFLEMWQWYSQQKPHQADPRAGIEQDRKMAQEAHTSVKQWLL
ncbi:hypothetical protein UPYG_G00354600 [Umbra pygmaea]|uniref:Uncharacterized protein n=1 Tax=Umbra pygmaea TaxID=75934 RepID=A0ABD0WB83_UMBPY